MGDAFNLCGGAARLGNPDGLFYSESHRYEEPSDDASRTQWAELLTLQIGLNEAKQPG